MARNRLAIGGLALWLAACGGGGDGGSGGMPPPAATTADRVTVTATTVLPTVGSGGTAEFVIVVANPSAEAASNVHATLAVGPGLLAGGVTTCSASGGATCPANPATLAVASLPAQGSLRFQVAALIAPGSRGSIVSTVSVGADNELPGANNTADVTLQTYSADVSVSGRAAVSRVASGGSATYTMTVSNAGPDAAVDVMLQNVVDAAQTLGTITCAASGGAACPAPGATMTVPMLPSGGVLVFTVATTVSGMAMGPIGNTLHASQAGDPVTANNVATASTFAGALTTVNVQSDFGDYIGQGRSYAYSLTDAQITFEPTENRLRMVIAGDERWDVTFQLPASEPRLQAGTYPNLQRFPFHDPAVGGLSWSGEGRGCNTSLSTLIIDSAVYLNGVLQSLALRFEQHCEGQPPALRGQLRWDIADTSAPPGPVNPPPANLWRPAAGATPPTGNYVYLTSEAGDFIGGGSTATYTQANATLSLDASNGHLGVRVDGNQDWTGNFQAMTALGALRPGYYADLRRYPFHNPAKGGLDWSGEGRGCNTLASWFVIDSIAFSGNALASVDARFEQHCEGGAPALRGQIHWVAGDPTQPPGPQVPPPAGLWTPPAGATPASGNYVYLQSDAGDFIGQGQTHLYQTPVDTIAIVEGGGLATVQVNNLGDWAGHFQTMNSIARLMPGYYANVQRWPFHNPATGGLDWSGMGRGCNMLSGWFVVDSISYVGNAIASLDLRFEQHCEGMTPALRGKIHWIN